ncbi:MAG: YceH family protein [Planctomycetaceae bacterium]
MDTDGGRGEPGGGQVRPLDAFERRVLGVLIEKAKTTPEQYPLSLNGVVVGCNQKSNRDPVMMVDEEQVARALEGLRKCGAAAEVFGSGKIPRYRHLAYEWLGVGKEELAIMGELLLRGEQTEGDLRGRASRMDPIPDLDVLRGFLDRLADRGLVVWLSPPGRGRMLTHGLLPEEKLEKVRRELGLSGAAAVAVEAASTPAPQPSPMAVEEAGDDRPGAAPAASTQGTPTAELERRIAALERDLAALRERLEALETALGG